MPLGDNKKKTHSQRLRNVLYRMWEHDDKGFENPDEHYEEHMEKLIDFCKNKLPKDDRGTRE
jgi:hypothetical protein